MALLVFLTGKWFGDGGRASKSFSEIPLSLEPSSTTLECEFDVTSSS